MDTNKWWAESEDQFGGVDDCLEFTTYGWPADRPVFLRRSNEFNSAEYIQVPYFNLRDPKISEGRSEEDTLYAHIRKCYKAAKFKPCHIVVVKCKEYPWLVGIAVHRQKLVPATNFIPLRYLPSFDENVIKIGTHEKPALAEDIRKVQEQLSQIPTDPNLTLLESHTIEFPHLSFLKKWDNLWHNNRIQKCTHNFQLMAETHTFECFVARLAWIYHKFYMQNKKIMVLPAHEPRNLLFGWVFMNRDTDECAYITVHYAQIKQASLDDKDSYCGKMAQVLLETLETRQLSHLELNRFWDIIYPNSYYDLLCFPKNEHREG